MSPTPIANSALRSSKKALVRVSGVKAVQVKQAGQMADPVATVTFDDAVTNVPALIAATTNAGYPSHLAN
jgi:periplasmic mercuric ion binding protein